MTDTVVERVARAIWLADARNELQHVPFAGANKDGYMLAARAALLALEEPTPEMVKAGALVLCEMEDDDSPSEFAARIFTAMIRRAQEE